MAVCVLVHAMGFAFTMRSLRRRRVAGQTFWQWTWLFILVAGGIILLHLIEISAWAFWYAWAQAMPDVTSAFYFSAVTYTTTGYGDLVLPSEWRLVGGIEALTGILLCGWSTGFFFAVVSRMFDADRRAANGLT
jgi:hypothetical protein